MDVPRRPRNWFKRGADEVEALLPAIYFASDTGSLKSALLSVSELLGLGRDHRGGLEALFSRRTTRRSSSPPPSRTSSPPPPSPLVTLGNVRRWALEGLRDDALHRLLGRGPLVAPDPRAAAGAGGRTKASRSFTARQARSVLANAFLGNVADVTASDAEDPHSAGGLDLRAMLTDSAGVGRQKAKCLRVYFESCAALEGTADDDRTIAFDAVRFVPLSGAGLSLGPSATPVVGDGVALHAGAMESPPRRAAAFVNFASPVYGYGNTMNSCTQEEILLVCCPELMVGALFLGRMGDNEVVNVRGVRRFCRYSGYLSSFQCLGPVSKSRPPPITTVLTLDACYKMHFAEGMVWRDVSKAYHSFLELAERHEGGGRPVVSTGKWGCGAFGGLAAHKMLLQALAAAAAGVDLDFSSFGSHEGCDVVVAALRETRPSVEKVVGLLRRCGTRETFVVDAVLFLRRDDDRKGSGKGLTTALSSVLGLVKGSAAKGIHQTARRESRSSRGSFRRSRSVEPKTRRRGSLRRQSSAAGQWQ